MVWVQRVFYACASGDDVRWRSIACVTSCPSTRRRLPWSHDALNSVAGRPLPIKWTDIPIFYEEMDNKSQ